METVETMESMESMKTTLRVLTSVLLAGSFAAVSVSAQSLADVARREQVRRRSLKVHGRLYTNADLQPAGDESSAPASASRTSATASSVDSSDASSAETGAVARDAATAEPAPAARPAPAKDRAYWEKRMTDARAKRDQARLLADAMQSRINALTADFTARDDPAQRSLIEQERARALAELDRLNKDLQAAIKGIADIQEEARRAGVPPGWVR